MTDPGNASFDLPPDEFRRLGHKVIELMADALEAERAEPVLRQISGATMLGMVDEPLPDGETSADDVIATWQQAVAPFSRRNGHPRFFGYVCTSADPLGMLADAMASAINQPVTAWRSAPAATTIERLVVRWLDDLVGFGGGGSGILVSGGSAANFHGLACAVTAAEHRAGLPPGSRHRLTAYISQEGHVSMFKALQLLGLSPDHVRVIGVDEHRRMPLDKLRRILEEDRGSELVPAVVCASAGTANTGAIDPLLGISDACKEHGVWLHIDGSYGAPAAITEEYEWMSKAFVRADSMSLDPHKWLFAPADVGCVLVRDDEAARRTFTVYSEYTAVTQTDPIERYAFFDHGFEMSRRFRGLKVWTILKARGLQRIRAAIQHNITLREYLDVRIDEEQRLEALGSELSITCFRYVPRGEESEDRLNAINRTILETLIAEGRCYMSPTVLDGKYALRACIVNFRTEQSDVDFLVHEIMRLGTAL